MTSPDPWQLIRETLDDHSVEADECDLCGIHTKCSCGYEFHSFSDHIVGVLMQRFQDESVRFLVPLNESDDDSEW